MPTATKHKLTAKEVDAAQPRERLYHLADGGNLYLCVYPSGRKTWRFIYHTMGRFLQLTLGEYPDISLCQARELAEQRRRELKTRGRLEPEAVTFAELAREWLAFCKTQYSKRHWEIVRDRLEQYVLPVVGHRRAGDIQPAEWFGLLSAVGRTKADTARRLRSAISIVLRYGIAKGVVERDTTMDIRGLLPTARVNHFPAPTDEQTLRYILRRLEEYVGLNRSVELALRIGPRLFVRPGELVAMRWQEVDLTNGTWTYFVGKVGRQHIVPLSRQVVEMLRQALRVSHWVFPSPSTGRHITQAALVAAYRTAGLDGDTIVPHSWRAIARTVLHERLGFDPTIIEAQLGHTLTTPLGRTYWRGELLDQRREMMQKWADYLDALIANDTKGTCSTTQHIANATNTERPCVVTSHVTRGTVAVEENWANPRTGSCTSPLGTVAFG
jgi:integrase